MSKESFKQFAKVHPELAKAVLNNQGTWQKYYEMYEMYGEDHEVWKPYLNSNPTTTKDDGSLQELFNMIKKVDLETVRKGVAGLQKAITLVQDLHLTGNNQNPRSYEPRNRYQRFDD